MKAAILPVYKSAGFVTATECRMKEYEFEMETCDHLSGAGVTETYKIDDFPKKGLFYHPSHEYDYVVGWNGGTHPNGEVVSDIPFENFPIAYVEHENLTDEEKKIAGTAYGMYEDAKGNRYAHISKWCYAVREHIKYLSDDYPYKCCECGKKWKGYESMGDEYIVDGKSYCRTCASKWMGEPNKDGRRYMRNDIIRDMLDLSTMYLQDNAPVYYTSIQAYLEHNRDDMRSLDMVYAKHIVSDRPRGSDALSGNISGDHWELFRKTERKGWPSFLAYVFEPNENDLEILERIKQ